MDTFMDIIVPCCLYRVFFLKNTALRYGFLYEFRFLLLATPRCQQCQHPSGLGIGASNSTRTGQPTQCIAPQWLALRGQIHGF